MDQVLNVASMPTELFDEERLELMRSASYNRIASRVSAPDLSPEFIREKYLNSSQEELLDIAVKLESSLVNLEDENYALIEQVRQLRSDIVALQADFDKFKTNNLERVSNLTKELESAQTEVTKRDAEIIFLQDHARFSNEQTKLSISHWDLLLKNRDENIELLSNRINQLTTESRSSGGGNATLPVDKYKCLLEQYQTAIRENKLDQLPTGVDEEPIECPWRHQAEVRVAQLERVTGQLNATYEQLHAKSDELLLLNRTAGTLRSSNVELEARVRKYKNRIAKLKLQVVDHSQPADTSFNKIDSTGMTTPSIESNE